MRTLLTCLLTACLAPWSTTAVAEDPLHERIDRLIEARAGGPVGEPAGDTEFLRRITLDLVGQIPTAGETRVFLKDASKKKRAATIDSLLADPRYPRRMAELFNVMLMERRGSDEHWWKFLEASFAANKPWDQLVREIVNPDAGNEATRGSAYFFTKRLEKYGQNPTDHPGLAADLGRLFLGKDFACAQCHDHLFIDEYKQADFQGLFAFVNNTYIRREKKFPALGERVVKAAIEFQSVFVMEQHQTGPKVPGGPAHPVPKLVKGEEYRLPPDKKTGFPGRLAFSPLEILATDLPIAGNRAFCRNIANRLWFITMGRGLVHPLDLDHDNNPASHPALLDLLTDEIVARKFDLRGMLRELLLTRTYQRTGLLPERATTEKKGKNGKSSRSARVIPPTSYRVFLEKPLSAEQLLWSMGRAAGQDALLADTASESFGDYHKRFLEAFANPPREPEVEFAPSVRAALFLLNDEKVLAWLKPEPKSLVGRLAGIDDEQELAEELYLSVLTRRPTTAERKEVSEFLGQHATDRTRAIAQLAWALLASTEFATNH